MPSQRIALVVMPVLDITQTNHMYGYCRVIHCGKPARAGTTDGLDERYCRAHADHDQRHGSPLKGSYTARELNPYRRAALAWMWPTRTTGGCRTPSCGCRASTSKPGRTSRPSGSRACRRRTGPRRPWRGSASMASTPGWSSLRDWPWSWSPWMILSLSTAPSTNASRRPRWSTAWSRGRIGAGCGRFHRPSGQDRRRSWFRRCTFTRAAEAVSSATWARSWSRRWSCWWITTSRTSTTSSVSRTRLGRQVRGPTRGLGCPGLDRRMTKRLETVPVRRYIRLRNTEYI